MKVWPIDPLVPRNLRLEVPEKLPQEEDIIYTTSFLLAATFIHCQIILFTTHARTRWTIMFPKTPDNAVAGPSSRQEKAKANSPGFMGSMFVGSIDWSRGIDYTSDDDLDFDPDRVTQSSHISTDAEVGSAPTTPVAEVDKAKAKLTGLGFTVQRRRFEDTIPVPGKVDKKGDNAALLDYFIRNKHQIPKLLLSHLPIVQHGWCKLVDHATNGPPTDKELPVTEKEGYVQLTHGGCNHFLLLHHAVAMLSTFTLKHEDHDASHLCHFTCCSTVGHVIWEHKKLNQQRKGCAVWVNCPHGCKKKVNACVHEPRCIKTIDGVEWEDFVQNPGRYIHDEALYGSQ
jgi:hypothetical protein